MDFFSAGVKTKSNIPYIKPLFKVKNSNDLMIRGKAFYAIWDEDAGIWSREESDVSRIVDSELSHFYQKYKEGEPRAIPLYMSDYDSGSWKDYQSYLKNMFDCYKPLDSKVTYLSQEVHKRDYVSKRLQYDLDPSGNPAAYDELMGTIYSDEERKKLEWGVGAVLAGDGAKIQKFFVLYGPAGSGKSTFLHILEQLFEGYWTNFDASSLTNKNSQFATHFFKENPLVAIQHDGNLSRIEDNSLLNSIVSHEDIEVNEKFKSQYTARSICTLFLGTNSPVKISDSKSGLIRRLIDVSPTGNVIEFTRYNELMAQIPFELGCIAQHCLNVYHELGKSYYNGYKPNRMMFETDSFFNFINDNIDFLLENDPITILHAYDLYKEYSEASNLSYSMARYRFRAEFQQYYREYHESYIFSDGTTKRQVCIGFDLDKFLSKEEVSGPKERPNDGLNCRVSLLDEVLKDCPAQYANELEIPTQKWANVKKKLKDLDTHKLHYVKPPESLIVVDFDLRDENGKKSRVKNLEAIKAWPKTYTEYSKGGNGIHLHYWYDGDISKLAGVYSDCIEIKTFRGGASLRRMLTYCNDLPIAHISTGLPIKKEVKKVISEQVVQDEQHLRRLIAKAIRKEIHANTAPNINFIHHILEQAYLSGVEYDVRDMRGKILTFASKSTNQSQLCLETVAKMRFCSEEVDFNKREEGTYKDDRLVFFDVEVFPNLLVVNWKYQGVDGCVRMINPKPSEIAELFKFKLVGFNNLRYDNYILYARYLGWSNEEIFRLSQKIIAEKNTYIGLREAKNISYTDVYDFAAIKQSLKKWEIELHIHHQELNLPWDKPVPEELWPTVAEYCDNDVVSTEEVFDHLHAEYKARQILAKLSGLSPNDTTNAHTTRIIFGDNHNPKLNYVDLAETFPGYEYVNGKNMYRGTDVGRGGYIYGNEGVWENVPIVDVRSMHPSSIIAMNLFGEYTPRFADLVYARLAIKEGRLDDARTMMGGILAQYLNDPDEAGDLAQALKIAINSVYGLTAASFPNAFRDPRNINNIVALRGALFMRTLQDEVTSRGYTVVGIRTDSIKIANGDREIVDFCLEFARKYGYEFDFEAVYDRMCLVNKSVYIAKYMNPPVCEKIYGETPKDNRKRGGEWTATGAQFAEPYVYKTLFTHEELDFYDICQTKEVSGGAAIYFDMNEGLEENTHDYQFVGRVGSFCPVLPNTGGGELMAKRTKHVVNKKGEEEEVVSYSAVTGAKDYRWLEAEKVRMMSLEDNIDMGYFHELADKAREAIGQYDDFDRFVGEHEYVPIR